MTDSIFWSSARAVPAFVILSLIIGAIYRQVAGRRGWQSWPTLGAGIALAGALALTLTPTEWDPSERVICIISMPARLGLFALPSLTQESLNSLLLLPFGFFSILATRRVWKVSLLVVIIPVCIELVQALVPIINRKCHSQDIVNNITGGLLGIAFGLLVLATFRFIRPGK